METSIRISWLPTDSAVGNQVPRYSGWKHSAATAGRGPNPELETKYRDIADGNLVDNLVIVFTYISGWKASTAISRIQNRSIDGIEPLYWVVTKRCVYYKRLVLYIVHTPTKQIPTRT